MTTMTKNNLPRGLTGLITLTAFLAVGCGSKGGTPVTLSSFCDDKAQAECGTTSGVASKCVVPAETCKASRIKVCMDAAAAITTAFPTTRPFQPSKTQACISSTMSTYSKPTITPADRAATDALCQQVFSGSKKSGETCANDYECDPGLTLICDLAQTTPICAKKAPVAKDAFCSSPGSVCPTGQYCIVPTMMTQLTCVNRKVVGDPCDATTLCLETLRCATAGTTVAGNCAVKVDSAGACMANSDCVTTAPYCDPYAGNKCTPGFTPALNTPECAAFGATI